MTDSRGRQTITFSTERDEHQDFSHWIWLPTRPGDTIAAIAARLGHPEDARQIADDNQVRSTTTPLPGTVHRLKVPGELRSSLSFDVTAGDKAPHVEGGYANLSIMARPERVGLTVFDGYDPITMNVPIRFEAYTHAEAETNERKMDLLEKMGGRGVGVIEGPPPIIRLSTTNAAGSVIPLIPRNMQWSLQNKSGPLWRIADIAWDDNPNRLANGNRRRQLATVLVQQHTRLTLATRSATQRSKTRPKVKPHAKKPNRARPKRK